jgi:hypothetical protein
LSGTLVILSPHDPDLHFCGAVASYSGLRLQRVHSEAELVQFLKKGEKSVFFVGLSGQEKLNQLEQAIQSEVGLFSEFANGNQFHFLSDADFEECPWLAESPLMGSFILRHYHDISTVGEQYGRLIASNLRERGFGISAVLGPSAKVQRIRLARSIQKQEAVEAVRGYVVAAGFNSRMATVVANAVDEALMNAIFDAPVDQVGKQEKALVQRSEDFALEGRNQVELEIGFDGRVLGVAAIDHFGSIDKTRLLRHISKVYMNDSYKVKTTSAGAGLGLSSSFQSGASFSFLCETGVRTEAMLFFSIAENYRKFREQFRFLSTQFYF